MEARSRPSEPLLRSCYCGGRAHVATLPHIVGITPRCGVVFAGCERCGAMTARFPGNDPVYAARAWNARNVEFQTFHMAPMKVLPNGRRIV